MLYFVIYKKKKDTEYKIFTNEIFDDIKKAEYFGKKSKINLVKSYDIFKFLLKMVLNSKRSRIIVAHIQIRTRSSY